MANTLHLSIKELEAKISYPPRRKRQARLPPIRCEESQRLLNEYRAMIREKKKAAAAEAPLLNFQLVHTATSMKQNPSAVGMLREGQDLLEAGKAEEATVMLQEAVRMGIDTPEVYTLMGDSYRLRGMPVEAVQYYTRAIELAPTEFQTGDWGRVRLYKERGECYYMLSDTDPTASAKAAAEFDKFLQVEDPTFDVLVQAGKAHLDSGNLERSGELLHKALEMDETAYLHFNLGELYEQKKDAETAKKHFIRCMEVDPAFPEQYRAQADEYFKLGTLDAAMSALNLYLCILKLLPNNAPLRLKLADVYDFLGDEYARSTLVMLSSALDFDLPADLKEDTYVRRGILQVDRFGAKEEALADLSMCLEMNPRHADALERRAAVLLLRGAPGDEAQAMQDLEVLVDLPQVSDSRKREPYLKLGDWYFRKRFPVKRAEETDLPLSFHDATNFYFDTICKAAEYYTAAKLRGLPDAVFTKKRKEQLMVALAVAGGYSLRVEDVREPVPPVSEEHVIGVTPLALRLISQYYLKTRQLEPTVHSELFLEFQRGWGEFCGFQAYWEEYEKAREAAKAATAKKKKK